MKHGYPAVFYRQAEGVGVVFPDLPGCVTVGADVREAVVRAGDALSLHLEGMDEETLPAPTMPVEAAEVDAEFAHDVIGKLLIVADRPRAKRIAITIDETLLAQIDRAAAERGDTRSGFLAEGARRLMRG